jgi:hypothetical protein
MRPSLVAAGSLALVMAATFAGMQVGRHGLANAAQSLLPGVRLFMADSDASQLAGREPAFINTRASANSGSIASDDEALGLPAVGANNFPPGNDSARLDPANLAQSGDGQPPLARMVGYVQPELHNASHLGSESTSASGAIAMAEQDWADSDSKPRFVASAVALPIPQPPRSEILALAPGLLKNLLENRDAGVAMVESQRAVLERFGRRVPRLAPGPSDPNRLQTSIEERGLTATSFDGGSIDLLRRLDHPVLLPLVPVPSVRSQQPDTAATDSAAPNSTAPRWLAITGFVGDRARLAGLISDRIVTVPIMDLAEHWLETGIIVWERYEPVPDLLALGGQGRGVLWLQRSLSELHFFEGNANGSFDPDTQAALIHFQRNSGLVADGIAGPLTQIALYAKLERYPVPRLSKSTTRTMPSSARRNPTPTPFVSTRGPDRSSHSLPTPSAADDPNRTIDSSIGDRR